MQEPPAGVWQAQPGVAPPPPPRRKPRVKKLRLALILLGISLLAVVSTVFGMLMAVASDLPSLENRAEYRAARNSILYSDGPGCLRPGKDGCQIATLAGNQNRILLEEGEISPNIKNAVIAIEDRRFYEHEGVDYTGIARALVQDVLKRRAAQGGSTITQQFVKNALAAQGNRSVFQKLRESALAYHLERQWSKDKILTQYLNTVYFGNGAYGIEAAVRTYFGDGDEPEEQQGAPTSGVQYATPTLPDEEEDPNARLANDVTPDAGRAARRDDLLAEPVRPAGEPRERARAAQPGAPAHVRAAADHPRPVRGVDSPGDPRRGRGRSARLGVGAAVLHELDDAAAGGPLRRGPRLRRRHEDQDDDRS